MKNLTIELKVGLLILTGLLAIVYASVVVTGWRPGIGDTYRVSVYFSNVSGLLAGSPAQIAGVKIGQVESISLEDDKARVVLSIYKSQVLGQDARASIKSLGILGDKYISILPGSAIHTPLQEGDVISLTLPGGDLDSLVDSLGNILSDFEAISASLRNALADERGASRLDGIMEEIANATSDISRITDTTNKQIDTILSNLSKFSVNMERITSENRVSIKETLDNLAAFSGELRNITVKNRDSLESIIVNLDTFTNALAKDGPSITNDLRQVLAENKQSLNNAVVSLERSFDQLDSTMANLESISEKIDEGEGTLGKLVNDETTVEELNEALGGINKFLTDAQQVKLDLGGHTEYLNKQKAYKSYFDIRLQPLKDRYYLIQLVDNPRGKVEKKTTTRSTDGGTPVVVEETVVEETFQMSLIIAQRYYDTVVRGGIMENRFGMGIDQYFGKEDQFSIGMDVWDFSNELGPHVKVTGLWRFYSNAFLVVGGDDLASEDPQFRDAFFGIGIHFNEDNLKTLMSGLPISSLTGN